MSGRILSVGRPLKVLITTAAGKPRRHFTSRFSRGATIYEANRPSYPPEAVSRIVEVAGLKGPDRRRVLDVAAGTGKFTRLLSQYPNLEVTALEPVQAMRKMFIDVLPATVPILEAVASDIPFPDGFFDAVTVAQAFHWFDNIESLREMHRVLKPGGALVLTWNMEDKSSDWVRELRDAYEPYDKEAPQYRKGHWKRVFTEPSDGARLFTPLQTFFVPHTMHVTKRQVWERVLSKSYIASLPSSEQEKLRVRVESILDRYQEHFTGEEGRALQPILSEVTWTYATKPTTRG